MVARRSTPTTIEISELEGPLAEALRAVARGDQTVQLTDGGRPLARITPIRPLAKRPAPDTDPRPREAELTDEERAQIEESRRLLAEAWAKRRAMTEPYVFDQAEHDRVMERRNRLREEFGKLNLPEFSAVDMVREQRRDY